MEAFQSFCEMLLCVVSHPVLVSWERKGSTWRRNRNFVQSMLVFRKGTVCWRCGMLLAGDMVGRCAYQSKNKLHNHIGTTNVANFCFICNLSEYLTRTSPQLQSRAVHTTSPIDFTTFSVCQSVWTLGWYHWYWNVYQWWWHTTTATRCRTTFSVWSLCWY